uniref:Uncharacterized protein n=1 Tax=Spongospora subterranea TaxID=70186 RepID=A0A0H5RDG0_9EUKA|eukprot:CRZ12043.1 hypothetical protein [Spongospora subterranea]
MENRPTLTRRCAGFKNLSHWMDRVMDWNGSGDLADITNRPHVKSYHVQSKSTIFYESGSPKWNSESKEQFKPYDVKQVADENHNILRMHQQLLDAKISRSFQHELQINPQADNLPISIDDSSENSNGNIPAHEHHSCGEHDIADMVQTESNADTDAKYPRSTNCLMDRRKRRMPKRLNQNMISQPRQLLIWQMIHSSMTPLAMLAMRRSHF